MLLRIIVLTSVLASPLALLAACGGGDDDYEAPPLTREGYVGAADPICARAQGQIVELRKSLPGVFPSQFPDERYVTYFDGARTIGEEALAELRKLQAQESDAARVAAMLEPLATEVERMSQLRDAAAGSDAQEYIRIASEPVPSRADMQAFGFKDCATLRLGPGSTQIPLAVPPTPLSTPQ